MKLIIFLPTKYFPAKTLPHKIHLPSSTLTPVNRSGAVMNQQRFDESTLIRIFAIYELYRLKEHGLTRGALNDYHSRYKLVFLAHSQPEYRKLGPFVADIHRWQNLDDYYNQYRQRVIVLLSHPANRRDHTNVLMHVQGYFRPHIDSTERQQLAALIDSYRRGEQQLLAPLMRIKHYMAFYPDAWLSGQRYFELWPRVINLRHSGVL